MDSTDIFKDDLKDQAGGILISDIVNNERVILLGKSNIPKRTGTYESFGGKTEKQDIGFIAHEVQKIYPCLVDGEKDGEQLQTVNYIGFIPIIIKEIQELKKEIENLKQKLC